MLNAACAGEFKAMYIQGEDLAQSDPNTQHVEEALAAMDCVIVQDLFLNETAKFAHVFFPGTSFLEKDGTFTNAERRINRVRPVMPPKTGMAEWEVTQALANALGYPMQYASASEIMDEVASLTPTFANVSFDLLDRVGSVQWPCTDAAPAGTPIMHRDTFVRGKGMFVLTDYQPTEERANRKFPLLLTTGRILSQYNVGAQTRRTDNIEWLNEDLLEIHPADAELRGVREGDWVSVRSRMGEISLRATVTERVVPGVVYTTFHHPDTWDKRDYHEPERLGDQLPGIQGNRGGSASGESPLLLAGNIRRPTDGTDRPAAAHLTAAANIPTRGTPAANMRVDIETVSVDGTTPRQRYRHYRRIAGNPSVPRNRFRTRGAEHLHHDAYAWQRRGTGRGLPRWRGHHRRCQGRARDRALWTA